MDRGAWQATVHRVVESDMTEQQTHIVILLLKIVEISNTKVVFLYSSDASKGKE